MKAAEDEQFKLSFLNGQIDMITAPAPSGSVSHTVGHSPAFTVAVGLASRPKKK